MDLIKKLLHMLFRKPEKEPDFFYEGRARRDNMSNPGDKDYEI